MGKVYANQPSALRVLLVSSQESPAHRENLWQLSHFALDIIGHRDVRMCNMTFEETGGDNSSERSACVCALFCISLLFCFYCYLFFFILTLRLVAFTVYKHCTRLNRDMSLLAVSY